MRFRDKVARFMMGRYGIDQLWYGLVVLYFLLMLAGSIVSYTTSGTVKLLALIVLEVLQLGVFAVGLFRIFSTNHAKRRRENELFLRFWTPVKNYFTLQRNKWRDRKTHVYRKCPEKGCGAVLRLPKKPGTHTVRCPKCHKTFETRI